MFDLQNFTFTQMIQVGANLRKLGEGAQSMEEASRRIVDYLYDNLGSRQPNQRACVLVRLFKTHPFAELDDELRQFAATMLRGAGASPAMKCLTLLATAGEKPE
jgi:two-component system NtrC family sensor kinase